MATAIVAAKMWTDEEFRMTGGARVCTGIGEDVSAPLTGQ
jgi:hypothetical protein